MAIFSTCFCFLWRKRKKEKEKEREKKRERERMALVANFADYGDTSHYTLTMVSPSLFLSFFSFISSNNFFPIHLTLSLSLSL